MNYELAEEVKQAILDEPNRLSMGQEIVTDKKDFRDALDGFTFDCYGSTITTDVLLNPPCGTAGCLAGWIVILGHPEYTPAEVYKHYSIKSEAAVLLDISYDEICDIYYTRNWDEDLRTRFRTKDLKVRAEVAAEVLDRLIQRKKKEEQLANEAC